jgi:prepilin-type N-terminal cleavage/methylation domain-containing protein
VFNYSPFNKVNIKGFSLIELMVAIGLMLIIFTVAVPNYRAFQRSRSLEKAYQELVADLRMAQEYAISGKKPQDATSPCVTNTLEGYYATYNTSTQYYIRVRCTNYYIIKTVNLSDVSISNFGSIGFKPLGGGTTIGGGSSIVITLTQANTGATKTVTINSGGEIH